MKAPYFNAVRIYCPRCNEEIFSISELLYHSAQVEEVVKEHFKIKKLKELKK